MWRPFWIVNFDRSWGDDRRPSRGLQRPLCQALRFDALQADWPVGTWFVVVLADHVSQNHGDIPPPHTVRAEVVPVCQTIAVKPAAWANRNHTSGSAATSASSKNAATTTAFPGSARTPSN